MFVLAVSLALVPARAEGGGDATVLSFGAATFHGSTEGTRLGSPLVGMASTPGGDGYWLASADGGVYSYGAARFQGSTGAIRLNQPIVGMAATPDGGGYWLVARDGGIFGFGTAGFFGSTGAIRLNQPIVGMASTADGGGYWLVAQDGGIFNFGNAAFHGSTGAIRLNQPIVGMASTRDGAGYWLVARDGGIFAFGNAPFHGSAAGLRLSRPATAIARSTAGNGYWIASADGGVYSFGDAVFAGAGAGRVPPGKAVVAMTASPAGGYWLLSADDVLAPGSLGSSVEAVQRRLLDLGYFVHITGRFDLLTRQAAYALEKAAGLPRAGVIGAAERAALERGLRPAVRSRTGTVIELDKTRQLIVVVRDGQPIWTFHTSTGNNRPYSSGGLRAVAVTPEGQFRIHSAINGLRISELGELWRPRYFTGGYAIHGSPSIPPHPASHGCARLSNAAIDFVWSANLMPIGTPVWVYS